MKRPNLDYDHLRDIGYSQFEIAMMWWSIMMAAFILAFVAAILLWP